MYPLHPIYEILFVILVTETIYLILLGLGILLRRLYLPRWQERAQAIQLKISRALIGLMEHKKALCVGNFPKEFSVFQSLLSEMESFDRRFQGSHWQQMKRVIGSSCLLPSARKFAKSRFWRKRNRAARACAIFAENEDEPVILSLLEDPVFLVRRFAVVAAVRLESKKGIRKIVEHMASVQGYVRYCDADILLQGSRVVFAEIVKMAKETKNRGVQVACAEILYKKTFAFPLLFVREWLNEKDPQIRLQALKILQRNPQEKTEESLLSALRDPDGAIRAAAICCLEHFPSLITTEKLEHYLSDATWDVRLQAARLLKKIGKTAVLKRQRKTDGIKAYEVAQYVLLFG
jgi:hypothetical protein